MAIPLDKLIDCEDNIYELTCAAIKEAHNVSESSKKDQIEETEKITSHVLGQILNGDVTYSKSK